MTITFVNLPSTTTTTWWGRCPRCGVWFDQHSIHCPQFTASGGITIPAHRPDCRCPTCRPDLHITHPDTLACERSGCQPKAQ